MSSRALPSELIERIFKRLGLLYGASFTRQWAGNDPEEIKSTWARELAGFTPQEIARGLEACRAREYPPTVPEFRNLCRPPPDADAAFYEAARLWPSREGWSHAAAYWAAMAIGDDVRKVPYNALRARWRESYDRALANPQPIPAPAPAPALPHRSHTPEDLRAASSRVFGWCAKVWPDWARRTARRGP